MLLKPQVVIPINMNITRNKMPYESIPCCFAHVCLVTGLCGQLVYAKRYLESNYSYLKFLLLANTFSSSIQIWSCPTIFVLPDKQWTEIEVVSFVDMRPVYLCAARICILGTFELALPDAPILDY